MNKLKTLLVDDHQLIRAGIRMLVESLDDIEVIGEASSGKAAIESITALSPDLVLLDISLPDISGLEVLATINSMAGGSKPKFLILSMHSEKEYLVRALRSGAAGYLLKEAAPDELEMAINAIRRGEQWVSPSLKEKSAQRLKPFSAPGHPPLKLSPRQIEVLTFIATGLCIKEIAARLNLSAKTIESHRAGICEKLGIRDTAGLVLYAVRHGLIDT